MIKVNLQGEKKDYRVQYLAHGGVLAASFLGLLLLLGILQVSANFNAVSYTHLTLPTKA